MGADLKRYAVYSIRKKGDQTVWVLAGKAFGNRDGSITVKLDALPLDGTLTLREGTLPMVPQQPEGVDHG